MLNFRRKKIQNRFFAKQIVFTIIGLIAVIFISLPLAKNISKQYRINNEVKELEKEIANFETNNLELKNTLKYLESDQFAKEQARINLNYKDEGEEVIVIKNLDENSLDEATPINYHNKPDITEEASNLSRWWRYFFLK